MPINRIHTLADGRRQYQVTDSAGKRHTIKSRKAENLKQFRSRCDKLDAMIAGREIDVSMTMDQLWDMYAEDYLATHTSAADNRVMRPTYTKHVQPMFGRRKITEIQRGMIHQHLTKLVSDGYSRSLVSKVRQCFSRPYAWLIDVHGLQINNPTQGLRVKHKRAVSDPEGSRVIPADDMQRFLRLASTTKYYNYYRLLSLTGLRPSEALGLQRQDVTLKHIEIRRGVTIDGVSDLKTSAAHRDIPITPEMRQVLADQLRQTPEQTDWLFPARTGTPSMSAVKSAHKRILSQSAVWQGKVMITPALSLSLYDFRHTFATRAADSGMPMHLLQRLLGHADAQTTMRYYVHTTLSAMDQMADHMSGLGSNLVAIDPQTPASDKNARQGDA